jgi:hypothetical protein
MYEGATFFYSSVRNMVGRSIRRDDSRAFCGGLETDLLADEILKRSEPRDQSR